MAIYKDFADWYRSAGVTPSPEFLEMRWRAVEELAGSINAQSLVVFLCLYCVGLNSGQKAPEFMDAIFRKHNSSFPNRENSHELRVLAGAILRQTIESQNKAAVSAALGFVCGTFANRRQNVPTADHIAAAERYLVLRGETARSVKDAPNFGVAPLAKERFDELLPATVFAANQTPNLRDPLIATLTAQVQLQNQALATANATLWRIVQSLREEADLLWWLQTSFSRDLAKAFSDISQEAAAIIFPHELANLTRFIPGPSAIFGMLATAIEKAAGNKSALTIAAATNATPRSWRERNANAPEFVQLADLCPIALALNKSLTTDGDADWFPVYRKMSDVMIEEPFGATEIAFQFYRERLFARAVSEMKA